MKKTIILLLTISLSMHCIYAQKGEGEYTKGIRGGFHSATMAEKGSIPDTVNSLNNFYIGVFREKKIVPFLHLGTGIEYFQNGLESPGNSRRVLHTLSVPVDLKLKLGPAYALGGIAANIKVAEKFYLGDSSYSTGDDKKSNWFDAPVFLGAGLKILFLTVEGRYHWGLLEARDGYYNRYFQLGAALSF